MPDKEAFFPVKATPSPFLLSFLASSQNPVTDRLLSITDEAEVEVLSMGWAAGNLWDKQVLQFKDKRTFKREILMRSQGYACWYARTIIPESCYALDPEFFNRLYSERLTPLVYNEPRVKRIYCDFYPVNESCVEWYWVQRIFHDSHAPLFARLSQFEFLERLSFFLLEIYLQDLLRFEQ